MQCNSGAPVFTSPPILSYLQLPDTYNPSPKETPIDFLKLHIHQLPPHLLLTFSLITTPKQRTIIPTIRNRRLNHALTNPCELSFVEARGRWPTLWEGRERRGEAGQDEREWVKNGGFLKGVTQKVGKLGELLGEYEKEREAERERELRRERTAERFVPEDTDSEEDEAMAVDLNAEETPEEAKALFERIIRERYIYGLLDSADYDSVDWNEHLDGEDDQELQQRWFDNDSDDGDNSNDNDNDDND